jgi:alpha,alpha-trehalase
MDGDQVYAAYLPQLKREYEYWLNGEAALAPGDAFRRIVRLHDGILLNRYWDDSATPRDEWRREDVRTAQRSFWDFSSRWFEDERSLASIEVTSLLPVDLNCLLFDLEYTLTHACYVVGDESGAKMFTNRSSERANAIRSIFWDRTLRAFSDYHFVPRELTHRLTAATTYPRYTGIATHFQANQVSTTLRKELLHEGGLATTLNRICQQWDLPNGWAPLQYVAAQGLRRYGYADLACSIATRWIHTNQIYYQHTGSLVEKYNVGRTVHGYPQMVENMCYRNDLVGLMVYY